MGTAARKVVQPGTAEYTHQLARYIRSKATRRFLAGELDRFNRGYACGEIATLRWFPYEEWVLQGIENEIDFLFLQAWQAGQ